MPTLESIPFGMPEAFALAVVAALAYIFGRIGRKPEVQEELSDELLRATEIARQLEAITSSLRRDLASHHAQVERFKACLQKSDGTDADEVWRELRGEAERVLEPTLRLTGQVATAYEQFRQQSQALSNFSGGRTDPLTGLSNSRALHEIIEMELSGHSATRGDFTVAILSVDAAADLPADTHSEQQERMLRAAEFVRPQLRDRDVLGRYGLQELVVVMPNTRLFGASVFGRRVRKSLSDQAGLVVSCGLAQSSASDTAKALLARADSALYSAKTAGLGLQYLHTGQAIRADEPSEPLSEPVVIDTGDAGLLRVADTPVE